MSQFDVIVIGQGYAGLCAAEQAAARGLRVASAEALMPGGLVASINELDPGPEGKSHCGPELTSGLAMENMERGVELIADEVTGLARNDEGWEVSTPSSRYLARHVVLATGARLRKLGVPGEAEFAGLGVSECADCDGPLYMGKETVIVGGGDSAFQEALSLAQFADRVTIVMRGATPRSRADLVDRVAANDKIEVRANSVVTQIVGDQAVTGVQIMSPDAGRQLVPASGVFAYIGLEPASGCAPVDVPRNDNGALVTDDRGATSLDGLWALGAVRAGFRGRLADAEADAARLVAALG